MIFIPLILFILGLLIGSFLNVVIIRINTGRTIVHGRSVCLHCNRELKWYELVPVFSFLGLRGKCRTCRNPISFQYPLVELATAITFVVLFSVVVLPNILDIAHWITYIGAVGAACMLIVIFVYDLRHKIIPDTVVYPLILLALLTILWHWGTIPGYPAAAAIVWGVAIAAPLFFIWFFSNGRLMGFGDVKLTLALGWLMGASTALAGLVISFWVGGLFGLALLGISRKHNFQSQIPFAPFLIIGAAIAFTLGITATTLFPML